MTKDCESEANNVENNKRDHEELDNSSENPNKKAKMTEDEAALYDRQIRLWGVRCQRRLREAKILVIGLNGLGAEIVKNLTLSGVASITIIDETPVSELDYSAQYFVVGSEPGSTRAEASKAAIQELNPNVKIMIDKEAIDSKNSEFFADFAAVFATDTSLNSLLEINKKCRENQILFYCGETWGFYGYGFLDLSRHTFFTRVKHNDADLKLPVLRNYCTLESALKCTFGSGLDKKTSSVFVLLHIINQFRTENSRLPSVQNYESDLDLLKTIRDACTNDLKYEANKVPDEMLQDAFGELSPVCAAVGGVLANEMIKGISKLGDTIANFLFFDGDQCVGAVQKIGVEE